MNNMGSIKYFIARRAATAALALTILFAAVLSSGSAFASNATFSITVSGTSTSGLDKPDPAAVWYRNSNCSDEACQTKWASWGTSGSNLIGTVTVTWPDGWLNVDWDYYAGGFYLRKIIYSGNYNYEYTLQSASGSGNLYSGNITYPGGSECTSCGFATGPVYRYWNVTLNNPATTNVSATYGEKKTRSVHQLSFDVPPADPTWDDPWTSDYYAIGTSTPKTCPTKAGYQYTGYTVVDDLGATVASGTASSFSFALNRFSTATCFYKESHDLTTNTSPAAIKNYSSLLPHVGTQNLIDGNKNLSALQVVDHTNYSALLDGSRYLLANYVGSGSVPASGVQNAITVNLQANSTVTWNYGLQHKLSNGFEVWVPSYVKNNAGLSQSAGDYWYNNGTVVPAISITNTTINDPQSGYQYTLFGYNMKVGSGAWALTNSVTTTDITMDNPVTVKWDYRTSQTVDVSASGVPDELKSGFSPFGPGKIFFSGNIETFTAPSVILDTSGDYKYILQAWYFMPQGGGTVQTGTGAIANVTITDDGTMNWSYKKYVRVSVSVEDATKEAADPKECVGVNDMAQCVSWAKAGQTGAVSSGFNYYPENSSMVLASRYQVTDSGDKVCVTGLVYGAQSPSPQLVDTHKAVSLMVSSPISVVWKYEPVSVFDVGQAVTDFPADWTGAEPSVEFVIPTGGAKETAYFFGGNFDAANPAKKGRMFFYQPFTSVKITWPTSGGSETKNYKVKWPDVQQRHIAGAMANLQPVGSTYTFNAVKYSDNGMSGNSPEFAPLSPGRSVLMFIEGTSLVNDKVNFVIVNTVDRSDPSVAETDTSSCVVGAELTHTEHSDPEGKTGYVVGEVSPYIGTTDVYDRPKRTGAIIPANTSALGGQDGLSVVWYKTGQNDIGWPHKHTSYTCSYPSGAETIEILSPKLILPASYPNASVYVQPTRGVAGYNPNEEHAAVVGGYLYAMRDDFNLYGGSEPYVLLKYLEAAKWKIKAFKVVRGALDTNDITVGEPFTNIVLGLFSGQSSVSVGQNWVHTDHKGGKWAKAASVVPGEQATVSLYWQYAMQPGFYSPDYDYNGVPDKATGDMVPFLGAVSWPAGRESFGSEASPISYNVFWPDPASVKTLNVGDTLFKPKTAGLPDISGFMAGKVIFDENVFKGGGPLAKLYAPLRALSTGLNSLPTDSVFGDFGLDGSGHKVFPELPYTLKTRLSYDGLNKKLYFKGADMGDNWLLPNIMTQAERDYLKGLSTDANWDAAIDAFYSAGRNPEGLTIPVLGNVTNPYSSQIVNAATWKSNWGVSIGIDQQKDASGNRMTDRPVPIGLVGETMALTAGMANGVGYVTLVENDDEGLGDSPVSLHVIMVNTPVYVGEIKVIKPENLFDERLTMRHTGDFGGEPENFVFEWYYQPATGSSDLPPDGPAGPPWLLKDAGSGMIDVTLEGDASFTDKFFAVRYYYKAAWPAPISVTEDPLGSSGVSNPQDSNNWSTWAGAPSGDEAQLAEGWIKRVTESLNLLDARVSDFAGSETNTRVSMISQLGEDCGADIAFNSSPEYLNGIGLISAYETILKRGMMFSVDAGITDTAANEALLLAASKLAYFYTLLGNEAYSDASDPTIGFGTKSGEYGTTAPSIFAFQNQMPSLLDEELVLLRGRDTTNASTRACPQYNRLIWNFTQGEGEMAYAQAYNISDQDGTGGIDEADARLMFPQGHGDAWGSYLTAMKTYYKLLRHANYTWVPRAEEVSVSGSPVTVDYMDERRFASIAALKAKAGAETLDLTYRQMYVDDPSGQWQGYRDTDTERAWGVDDWARRAGQGAYFDWAAGNAVLPPIDSGNTGIKKVDRTTVVELADIAGQYEAIQGQMDKVDKGLNPLGLAKGVVPFDIDPVQVSAGKTHFEQVYERALKAMDNAMAVYDHANQFSQMLRKNDDTLDEFKQNIGAQEQDYMNRLIEVFGYPYPDDIGAGKSYPSGYSGPDWKHYMYVDKSELTGKPMPDVETYTVDLAFGDDQLDPDLGITSTSVPVTYHFEGDSHWMTKPAAWTSKRRAPGEVQRALSEFILAQAAFNRGLTEYDQMLGDMEDARENLTVRHGILANTISITKTANNQVTNYENEIRGHNAAMLTWRRLADINDRTFDTLIESLPKSAGLSADISFPLRGWLHGSKSVIGTAFNIAGDTQEHAQLDDELNKEKVQRDAELKVTVQESNYEVYQLKKELEGMLNGLVLKQLELATLKEAIEQASGRYLEAVAKGQRVLSERAEYRKRTSADVQEYRYDDLAFRVFRNDALQKYRATFDLAARYVYLTATAYDYETNLLGTDSGSGGRFLEDIIRQRSLGQMISGAPVAGQKGLADPLARLSQNFDVYKTQLGFNNPQTETTPFSLRSELFRLKADPESWRSELTKHRVADLWAVPEFKRFCRPFAPEGAKQPGLVIPFETTVTFGKNFFGWPLSGGDSAYDPTNFATKVRSVGVWFTSYNLSGLSNTPRIYLIPVGADILRSPSGDGFATREWRVVDQKLPVPFPIGATSLSDKKWIPMNDSLSEDMEGIRRYSSFRAYHDGGFTTSEMSSDSRLIGRSVWNTKWMLIIPGGTFLYDPGQGLDTFIDTVSDIKLFFQTYAYSGN